MGMLAAAQEKADAAVGKARPELRARPTARARSTAKSARWAPRIIANKPPSSPSGSARRRSTTTLSGYPQHRSPKKTSFHRLSFTPVRVATAITCPPNRGSSTLADSDTRRHRYAAPPDACAITVADTIDHVKSTNGPALHKPRMQLADTRAAVRAWPAPQKAGQHTEPHAIVDTHAHLPQTNAP